MPAMRASGSLESRLRWLEPRPPSPTMATLIRSFAPQTRAAAAAVAAPMKNLREVRSDIERPRLLYRRPLYMVAAWRVANAARRFTFWRKITLRAGRRSGPRMRRGAPGDSRRAARRAESRPWRRRKRSGRWGEPGRAALPDNA